MGGKRQGAGRHPRGCDCEKCQSRQGSRPVDGNVARKIKAKIKAEELWVFLVNTAKLKAVTTGNTADLRNALEYLDNRDLGNTTDNVNHMHDKPIEMTVTLDLAQTIEKARKRAASR